jgi:light-independent protochlorophyllide reductase subunit N
MPSGRRAETFRGRRPRRRRARPAALARYRAQLAGKRIFFFPDSQLEMPLARFLSRANSAWSWSRSARPTCTASISPPNCRCCRTDVHQRRASTSTTSSTAAAPPARLVVCGLGLANPLEAEGITTKWSIELLFTPIQGYEQAADLAELFARPLVRARLVAV